MALSRNRKCRSAFEVLEARRLMSAAVNSVEAVPHDHHDHGDHDHQSLAAFNVPAPVTVSLTRPGEYLTAPTNGAAAQIALDYLQSQSGALGVSEAVIADAAVTSSYTDADTGLTHTYWQQRYNGLPVLNAVANATVDAAGRVLTAAANYVPVPKVAGSIMPELSAMFALGSAAAQLGIQVNSEISLVSAETDIAQTSMFVAADLQSSPIKTSLVYVGHEDGDLELSWHTILDLPDGSHWYELAVSATTGEIVVAAEYYSHASYNAYALPLEAPSDGGRTVIVDPQNATASPFGWHDTNGVAGAEFTITRGNNAYAYLDTDANNSPDGSTVTGYQIDGTASLTFNPAVDLTQAPSTLGNRQMALTQLFYSNNAIHDITYQYGFTEAAGNFQANNYGKGGAGNDAVNAEAQDGSGTNNANFGTPADGSAPRMQMFLFTAPNPDRDGDLDTGIVIHEYGHGVSNRLTGGPANASALQSTQSGGMGEGWSDFLALMLTQKSTDTSGGAYPMGTYALGQSLTGAGIRRQPYSTNMSINTQTLGTYNTSSEVHNAGELWCSVLWDLNWNLIGRYGPTTNLAAGYVNATTSGGSALTLRLVLDGMKLQPANPTFLQARDAVIQADLNLTGGANRALIWSTFARRGWGLSASTANANSTSVVQSFDVPNPNPFVASASLTQTATAPVRSISLVFSEAVVPSSFSVFNDVSQFTGPGGVDLRSQISSAVFSNGDKTLTLGLSASQGLAGAYTLKLRPSILAADDGAQLDQDADGVIGSAADVATVVVSYNPSIGPDGGGYSYTSVPVEALDLVVGGAGVVDTGLSADDSSATISLGTNTFNLYGVTYSGTSSVFVSTNGLIRFGTNSTANDASNGSLTSSPTQATIAAFWDDLVTNIDTNDRILYRFQDTTGDSVSDRLIIEWSQVRGYVSSTTGTSGTATFQAILELNTGSRIGNITLNYPDLDFGSTTYNSGIGATVGIKASGTQGTSRTLVSQNSATNPYFGTGKAIRFGIDVAGPVVTNIQVSGFIKQNVTLTLNEAARTPTVSDFVLTNLSTGNVVAIDPATLTYNAATKKISFTLPFRRVPLGYRLTIAAGRLTDLIGNTTSGEQVFDFGASPNTATVTRESQVDGVPGSGPFVPSQS